MTRMMKLALSLILVLAFVPVNAGATEGENSFSPNAFFAAEKGRIVPTPHPSGTPDFDIIILHVCSLGWDDLDAAGLRDTPFFRQFDYLFTNFNSVTGHSGPSVIRLLRGACGQQRHGDIYNPAPEGCYLHNMLTSAGFIPATLLNHNGKYGTFLDDISRLGGWKPAPMNVVELPAEEIFFDNSPIYDDFSTLDLWAHQRTATSPPTALYYNTISLHDGTHDADAEKWWKIKRENHYATAAVRLFKDLTRFMDTLERSGRKTVVILAGEHGMALRGDALEAAGDREIPLPRITRVPFAIRLINGQKRLPGGPMVVDAPVTHLAIGYILSRFADTSPFTGDEVIEQAVATVPLTPFVADNGEGLVVLEEGHYFLYDKNGKKTALETGDEPIH